MSFGTKGKGKKNWHCVMAWHAEGQMSVAIMYLFNGASLLREMPNWVNILQWVLPNIMQTKDFIKGHLMSLSNH